MRRIFLLVLIALVFSAGFIACGKTTHMTGADLENAAQAKLNSDERLKTANLEVRANVDRKEVTLSGTVESDTLRIKAIELAKSVQPDLIVNDKIDVQPREVSRAGG
ncbi:MAG: BON domain-containing protein [Candidatus Binatia bacterium]